jgi:hypothetical protein
MTAENWPPEEERQLPFAPWIAAALLTVATLATFGGWLYTVRELNRLANYPVVGAEALRLAQSARAAKAAKPEISASRRQ